MENSLNTIQQLVENFKTNEAAYLASNYSESQVRQDFIDKFFTALGWDVTHTKQFNPYAQEVKIENRVTMPGTQRRADYAFSIAPNFDQIKFFVEAKKPSRSLANADDYFQTIRYAWNTKIPIAVLTDFEEFHILDCRYKPNIKTALERRIGEYRYTDYADKESFAKIFHLFGREAVAAGSLEKYAAGLPKKGTKQVGGIQPVDDAFLEELDGYREILAKAFKKTNESLQGDELTEAVQRTIDRLVFIRFLEDKGIEDKQIISIDDPKTSWKSFITICKRFEPKYNGLVFKSHRILDSGEFHSPDGTAFATICQKISDPSSPYDFNFIPISILGSIYERFLGKVVHATEKRVKVEEKPEVRKAGGVYYTPEYIVRYIVKETVGKLIEGKKPEQIASMAFADIACGSGSFLIEVYAQVLEYHLQYYLNHPESVGKDVLFERDGKKYLTLKKKKEILTNNVYGVDIDFQATEVTQLSLYLKMLENATMNDAHQFALFRETILPDLRQNVICGNSLIGRDILEGDLFSTVDESKLKPMNYEDAFPKIMKRGGFDAVVGNPPYVRQELLTASKEYLEKNYKVSHGNADLYTYFIEKGIVILRKEGLFGYIILNKWIKARYGQPLRIWLKSHRINRIIDFGDLQVFKGATTYPCILLIQRSSPNVTITVALVKQLNFSDLAKHIKEISFDLSLERLDDDGWQLENTKVSNFLQRIINKSTTLERYVNGQICRGVLSGYDNAFVIDDATKRSLIKSNKRSEELIKPYLMGRDVGRYALLPKKRFLIFTRRGTDIDLYPAIKEYLSKYRSALQPKPQNFNGTWKGRKAGPYQWYEIQDSVEYFKLLENPKIVYLKFQVKPAFTYDTEKFYPNSAIWAIPVDDKYLLGILNSRLGWFLISKHCTQIQNGYQLIWEYFKNIPIWKINFSDQTETSKHKIIVSLVEQMLEAKQKLSTTKTDGEINRLEILCESIDRKIDEAVYELYGLTEDEIKIVEGES